MAWRSNSSLLAVVMGFALLAAVSCQASASDSAGTTTPQPAATPTTGDQARPPDTKPKSGAYATFDPRVIVTDAGPVRGQMDEVRSWESIPYAAPPVGDLRWRNPRPPDHWTEIRDVTRKAPFCTQSARTDTTPTGTEDCLYLSVYAPRVPAPDAPTIVWFHGGGFTLGSPTFTDPSVLAERFGAVVISPAYRLGPFGFAATDGLAAEDPHQSTGSYGLADQQRALEWTRDNAAAFGGNPDNVTIAGESAGGWSVCAHLVSPRSRGLFAKAIVQSGPCTMPLVTRDKSRQQGVELAKVVGCERGGQVDLTCLRAVPAERILSAVPSDGVFGFNDGVRWGPTVDGWYLEQPIGDAVRAGKAADVPLLIGWNRDEGHLFSVPSYVPSGKPFDGSAYHDVLLAFAAGDEATATQIEQHYPLTNYPDPQEAFLNVLGDASLKCPGRDVAVELAKRSQPVFVYSFAYPNASFQIPVRNPSQGAFHTAELQFTFATPLKPDDRVEQMLASAMATRWIQFARTGSPNGGFLEPAWPAFTAGADAGYLLFDRTVTTGVGLDQDICDFWGSLGYRWLKN